MIYPLLFSPSFPLLSSKKEEKKLEGESKFELSEDKKLLPSFFLILPRMTYRNSKLSVRRLLGLSQPLFICGKGYVILPIET